MKAIFYTLVLAALVVSSCATGGRLVKNEYDDLYYLPTDRVVVNKSVAARNLPGEMQQAEQYFDNIYSADTLIAEQYNENVDFNNSMYYNKDYSPFEYMDDWSYSNRLRRFYGNYFYPYWRDPFYSWNYSPWYYYDYLYNPYYWSSLYDPFYYGGGYYGFYSNFPIAIGIGSWYSPFLSYYSYWPTYRFYYSDDYSSTTVGRRERYSSLTSNYSGTSATGRRNYSTSTTGSADAGSRTVGTASNVTASSRRTESAYNTSRQGSAADLKSTQIQAQTRRDASTTIASRPEYNQVSRSYTPTYNNPRLSDRPSYNTSRISSESVQRSVQNQRSNSGTVSVYRSNPGNFNSINTSTPSSFSVGQTRSSSPAGAGNYSAPSIRSISREPTVSSSRRYDSGFSSSGMSGSVNSGSSGGGSSIGSSGGSSSGSSGGVSTGTRR